MRLPVLPVRRNLMACRQHGHKHGPDLCKKGACKNTILSSRDPHYSLKENVKQKIQRSKPKKHAPYAMLNICFSSYSGKENKCVKKCKS